MSTQHRRLWTHSDEFCWPASLCDACKKRLSRDAHRRTCAPDADTRPEEEK